MTTYGMLLGGGSAALRARWWLVVDGGCTDYPWGTAHSIFWTLNLGLESNKL